MDMYCDSVICDTAAPLRDRRIPWVALGVFNTGSLWPNLVVAAVLAVLGMTSGGAVIAHARVELARR
jgi:hypothetical protein